VLKEKQTHKQNGVNIMTQPTIQITHEEATILRIALDDMCRSFTFMWEQERHHEIAEVFGAISSRLRTDVSFSDAVETLSSQLP
jgi:type II secretory pathway component PulF